MKMTFPDGFFSLPVFREEQREAEATIASILAHAATLITFAFLFNIPSVRRVTGVTLREWLILVSIHVLFVYVPAVILKWGWKNLFWGLHVMLLNTGLCCLLVFFSARIDSILWVFYFLYAAIMANAFAMNIYSLLVLFFSPLITAYAMQASSYFNDPLSDWIRALLISSLGVTLYAYNGSLSGKYMAVLRRNAELEKILEMERERAHIAREMHDGIGAEFTGIISYTGKGISSLGEGADMEAVREVFGRIDDSSRRGIKEVRSLIHTISQESQTVEFLVSYLKRYASDILSGQNISIRVADETGGCAKVVPSHIFIAVFRIVQESCQNILKHSGATEVNMAFRLNGKGLEVEVMDNGKGFDYAAATGNGGHGLRNMEKRVKELGGEIAFAAMPGKGAEIRARFPLT